MGLTDGGRQTSAWMLRRFAGFVKPCYYKQNAVQFLYIHHLVLEPGALVRARYLLFPEVPKVLRNRCMTCLEFAASNINGITKRVRRSALVQAYVHIIREGELSFFLVKQHRHGQRKHGMDRLRGAVALLRPLSSYRMFRLVRNHLPTLA